MTSDDPIDALSAARALRLRAMNELIRERRIAFEGSDLDMHAIMCECVDPECCSMLQVADEDLQTARAEAAWFIVDPAHVDGVPVVSRSNSHCVVRMQS